MSALFVEEHHAIPVVSALVLARTGTASDPPGLAGLARHAAELMRRGAGGRTRAELDATLDELGASIDVISSTDAVGFAAHALARHLPRVIELMTDVLARPTLDAEEHERLRRESLAILDDVRDDDGSLCARFFEREAFPDHAYGWPALGTAESLARVTVADAAAWARTQMQRPNLVVGFAGAVALADAERLSAEALAPLAAGAAPPAVAFPAPGVRAGRRTLLIDKPERTQTQILIGHAVPPRSHPDWLPLSVGAAVFGGTFTSRLTTEIRVKRGWSYGAGCRLGRGRFGSSFRIKVFPSAELTHDTLALTMELFDQVVAGGVTAEEVQFAIGYLAGSWPFELATPADRLSKRLDTVLLDLPADTYPKHLDKLAAIDAAAVNAAIKRWWRPKDAVTVLTATADDMLAKLDGLPIGPVEVVPFDSF